MEKEDLRVIHPASRMILKPWQKSSIPNTSPLAVMGTDGCSSNCKDFSLISYSGFAEVSHCRGAFYGSLHSRNSSLQRSIPASRPQRPVYGCRYGLKTNDRGK